MASIYSIAFLSGLAVMGIELSASRLMAPYFGTSLFVWTNVIGVILAALSLGYYLGGKISEKHPRLRVLLIIILCAGVLVSVIPFIVRPIANLVSFDANILNSASVIIVLGSFLLTLALFFMPVMLLGMTSPYLIKLVSHKRQDMGNVAGRIFAISTLGSIIGTFLPALLLIPAIGTKFTILAFAGVLILMALVGLLPRKLYGMIPLLGLPVSLVNPALKPASNLLIERESPYQYVQVLGQQDERQLVFNEGGGVQSVWNQDGLWYGGTYFDAMALLPSLVGAEVCEAKQRLSLGTKEVQPQMHCKASNTRTLIIGLAGGTIARAMDALYGGNPNFEIEGVEIDPVVTEIAQKYFDLPERVKVRHADGRNAVQFGEARYDLIVVDAYANQLYIPFHLATQEFFTETQRRLAPRGLIAINVNAPRADSELLVAITNTMASVFPYVYRAHVHSWNYIILGSARPIDTRELGNLALPLVSFELYTEVISGAFGRFSYNPDKRVLTDDWAPLEHMTDTMIWQALVERLKN